MVTPYSSRGPTWYDGFVKPDVVAPGHALISVTDGHSYLYKRYKSLQIKSGKRYYIKLSGTSMATAVTTGVIATVLQASNWASTSTGTAPVRMGGNAMKAVLQYTALPLRGPDGALVDELTQGTGAVNAEGAARFAWVTTTLAANPGAFRSRPEYLATGVQHRRSDAGVGGPRHVGPDNSHRRRAGDDVGLGAEHHLGRQRHLG